MGPWGSRERQRESPLKETGIEVTCCMGPWGCRALGCAQASGAPCHSFALSPSIALEEEKMYPVA